MQNHKEYIDNVVLKLKSILNITSDRQLALKLDIMPSSFANTIKRGLLPYEKILFFAINNKISLDEIFLLNNNKTATEIKNIINQQEESLKDLVEIKILNTNENTIKIPLNSSVSVETRAYIDDKKIYIIDTEDKEVKNNSYYLVKSNEIYFAFFISIDLDGSYNLKNDEDLLRKISSEDFSKIEIIGRISYKLNRETYI